MALEFPPDSLASEDAPLAGSCCFAEVERGGRVARRIFQAITATEASEAFQLEEVVVAMGLEDASSFRL